jgi:dihydrofolate synthase/folylpolyglutamate synthase
VVSAKPDSIEGWLEQLGLPAADRDYRPGHARMQAMLAEHALRRPGLRIRVAGTNGKGSTATMLAAALQASGYRVGLYTSPHLYRFHERIRIGGEAADDAMLASRLERLMPGALAIGASYFEVATALALACFSEAGVDVEILEAGVGARLDATTAVPADAAVLTPIGLDHQAWLGDTLAAIAGEKAWVMDGCRLALSAAQVPEVLDVLQCRRPDLALLEPAHIEAMPSPRMAGAHQRRNAALAWRMVQLLGESGMIVPGSGALAAIADVALPGRLQPRHWGGRRVWLDAAHNMHAIEALLPSLRALAPFAAILVLTRQDRDLSDAAPLLRPLTRHLVIGRGNDAEAVVRELEAHVASGEAGDVLVMGSFVTLSLASAWLEGRAPNPRR